MKNIISLLVGFFFLVGFLLYGCTFSREGDMQLDELQMNWEDDFKTELSRIGLLEGKDAQSTIQMALYNRSSLPSYKQFLSAMKKRITPHVRSSIRLEISNPNTETYFGYWFIEHSEGTQLCIAPREINSTSVECLKVEENNYEDLWYQLEKKNALDLKSDASRANNVLDASTYFVSLHRNERSQQFFAYAPGINNQNEDIQWQVIQAILDTPPLQRLSQA